ncbi:hypothetical protein GCM10009539_34510 [Cryptosporangium japonicum]|uniref:Uncharacterized protein n=1 Tax=Cryptosporangium japonicum TaxID=80872 RepID=A0ABN0UCT3_9ACTN
MPCGARISAGKFGNVDKSLPNDAVSEVNRSPVNCIPSPESPANRITTRSNRWTCLLTRPSSVARHRGSARTPPTATRPGDQGTAMPECGARRLTSLAPGREAR